MKRKKRQHVFANIGDIIRLRQYPYMSANLRNINFCVSCYDSNCESYALVISRYRDNSELCNYLQLFFPCTGKTITRKDGNFVIVYNAKI